MKIIAHKIGNKINGEGVALSDELMQLDDNTSELLQNYFLSAFKSEETFNFYSESYLQNNIAFAAVTEIFNSDSAFIDQSKNLARLLYDAAENPRVQSGELFIVYFNAETEKEVDKIGIFKTEKKESFFNVVQWNHPGMETDFRIETDKGFSFNRIDKAALIYNREVENGYILSVVDNNKNGDMYYWFEDFLKVRQRTDDYFHTQESLSVFKDYIKKQLPSEFEVTKTDQADFLNKSINYFKEKEAFNLDEFTSEVLEDEQVIESFNNFKTDYEQDMQLSIAEEFPISEAAVKKSQKHFKSIIKLDKNFHIYIHGDKSKIKQDQDETGKFYKVYFEKES